MRLSHGELASSYHGVLSAFWARVDRIVDAPASACFTPDCEMILGFMEARGVDEIDGYFRERAERERAQGRHTRHVLSNVWVEGVDDAGSDVRSILTVYAGIGDLPLPAGAPSVVADFRYRLIGPADDPRIASLRAASVFVGPGSLAAASSATPTS